MSDPLVPNFKPGVGRLATDRYDFEAHIEGKAFRHQANQIDLFPTLVIGGNTKTNVQDALAALAGLIAPPVIPDATASVKGILRLAGDLGGPGGTALTPKVSGLQGFPVANTAPTTNYVLTWTGSAWSPQPIISSFVAGNDLAGSNTSQSVIGLTGTGSPPNATVSAKCDIITFIATATPQINQLMSLSGDGVNILVHAQQANTGTGGNGGVIILEGGGGGGFEGNLYGGVILELGDTTYMVEATHIGNSASGSRVLSLVGNTQLTSVQMPTNTGNRVIFIGNAQSNPSASPSGGSILFSSGNRLFIQQGDGAQFIISPNYLPTRTATSSTPMTVSDVVMLVDTSTLSISITLPLPELGRRVVVKDSKGFAATRNISVLQNGAEKIEGLATTKLIAANWGSLTLVSDGTDWFAI